MQPVAVMLSDSQIQALLDEPKPLPEDYLATLAKLRAKPGHRQADMELKGAAGSEFLLRLRQSLYNPLDFSIILGYRLPRMSTVFRLIRHNGKSHLHSNPLEGGSPFYDFHIHHATERYQVIGCYKEDHFAEPTVDYVDFRGALDSMLAIYGFLLPKTPQPVLTGFGGES